ncbi:ATP-dependent zinc metalloprotease FtsH [Ruminococcus sp. HUN007]|uniref:ATP-dependent zinc metalloprotease FtsH n=1 Tax=Ruminococcus sp. HUN007 TaxID=1514668 RepID=UPI000AA5B79D|nr:ATP-dependent zinc metalloprotease FtsH [Ruminococcus sp. HUN007]
MTPRKNKGLLTYICIAAVIIIVLGVLVPKLEPTGQGKKYSEIMHEFDEYRVTEYTLNLKSGELEYYLEGSSDKNTYIVPNVNLFINDTDSEIADYRAGYREKHNGEDVKVDYIRGSDNSWIITVVPTVLLLIMGVALFFFMIRQAGGGGKYANFGKANIRPSNGKKTTFDDVAGADEEKEELKEIVDFLKNTKKYDEIGARVPKGVLLLGPPGTGKTLLARAVAGEANVPFFSISGSDFVEMFVGVGASRVRDLFEQAKKNSPSIVFIDEIDAVGRHRGAGLGGGHDEREQTLNQLLVEMDGFTANDNVIVMAATNRRDILDPALLRPGRFDRQIVVNYPDVKGREDILKVHAKNKPLGPDVDLKVIAKTTQGFTGADLENLLNEAALLAARQNRKAIIESDIEEATMKVIAGPEKKSHIVTDRDKKITAYHEGGHAIAAYYLETQDKVHQITVIQRGMAAGLTVTRPETDDSHMTRTKMRESIVMLLGGRVAEEIVLDDICTGASNDLERATKVARNMVTKYGFSEKLGTVVYGDDNGEVFLGKDYGHTRNYSEEIASEIDAEVRRIIAEAHEQCEAILREHLDELHLVAKYLIENEKIDGDDFEKLIHGELDVKKDEIPSEKEKPTETDININIPEEKKDEPEISVGFSKESDDTEVSVSVDSAKKTDSEDSDNTEE